MSGPKFGRGTERGRGRGEKGEKGEKGAEVEKNDVFWAFDAMHRDEIRGGGGGGGGRGGRGGVGEGEGGGEKLDVAACKVLLKTAANFL